MRDVEDETKTPWARLLAYATGLVNQELLQQNEYRAAENRIWKARLRPGWRLSDGERATLAEIGRRLGRKGLPPVARLARPDTIGAAAACGFPSVACSCAGFGPSLSLRFATSSAITSVESRSTGPRVFAGFVFCPLVV
jgi:hypothetical protein